MNKYIEFHPVVWAVFAIMAILWVHIWIESHDESLGPTVEPGIMDPPTPQRTVEP